MRDGEGPAGSPRASSMVSGPSSTSLGAGGGTRTPTGLRPTDFLTSYGFRRPVSAPLAPMRFVVWTIPSPYPVPRSGVQVLPV